MKYRTAYQAHGAKRHEKFLSSYRNGVNRYQTLLQINLPRIGMVYNFRTRRNSTFTGAMLSELSCSFSKHKISKQKLINNMKSSERVIHGLKDIIRMNRFLKFYIVGRTKIFALKLYTVWILGSMHFIQCGCKTFIFA